MRNNNFVTPEHIDRIINESIIMEQIVFDKCLIMSAQLSNGFVIVANSACVDPMNFDIEVGRQICYDKIKDKIWELEGYKLQDELYNITLKPID